MYSKTSCDIVCNQIQTFSPLTLIFMKHQNKLENAPLIEMNIS